VGAAKVVVKKAVNGSCLVDYGNESRFNPTVVSSLAIGQLTIPNDIIKIGRGIFWKCYGLTGELTIPDSVVTIMGNFASPQCGPFGYCTGFTSLHLGSKVETIDHYAFRGSANLTGDLVFPSALKSVMDSSFWETKFTSLTISNPNTTFNLQSGTQIEQIIFKDFNNLPSTKKFTLSGTKNTGTLVTSGGSISNADALNYAKSTCNLYAN
jgi:hypothetical protein